MRSKVMASGKFFRRREFLAGVASVVVLRPPSAGAEQTQQTRRIGVLVGLAPSEDLQRRAISVANKA
jgi:hypothetical protein